MIRPKPRPYVQPERFADLRRQAGLDWEACAALLGVHSRAVRYWEAGQRRIPYAAFRLLRILTGRGLPWPGWEDFMIVGGHLISPEGHRFSAGDLAWLSLTFRQAESFRSTHAELSELRQKASFCGGEYVMCPIYKSRDRASRGPASVQRRGRGPRETSPKAIRWTPSHTPAQHGRPFGSPPQADKAGLGPHLAPLPRRAAAIAIARPRLVCSAERRGART